jgi:hypothetical protein
VTRLRKLASLVALRLAPTGSATPRITFSHTRGEENELVIGCIEYSHPSSLLVYRYYTSSCLDLPGRVRIVIEKAMQRRQSWFAFVDGAASPYTFPTFETRSERCGCSSHCFGLAGCGNGPCGCRTRLKAALMFAGCTQDLVPRACPEENESLLVAPSRSL